MNRTPLPFLPFSPLPLFTFCLCLAVGCGRTQPPAEVEEHPSPVKMAAAEKKTFGEWTDLIGTTQPLPGRSAHVSTLVEGRVLWLFGNPGRVAGIVGLSATDAGRFLAAFDSGNVLPVAEGQHVREGQLLLQLDDRLARLNRDELQSTLSELEERKKQAECAVELAQIEVQRLTELINGSPAGTPLPLASKIELDKARVALKDAESKSRAVVKQEETTLEKLKALNFQLTFYELRAPFTGRLGIVQARPGQTLAIGTSVTDITDLSEIDVLCFAPPRLAARLVLDQPARVVSDEHEAGEPTGRVVFIALTAQPDTGNVAVKIRLPNPDLRLKANAVRRVQVLTKTAKEHWSIPEDAVREDQDPPAVVVVADIEKKKNDEGKEETLGKARVLQAVLGVRDRGQHRVEILELIDPEKKEKVPVADAHFITEGGHGLEAGDLVKIEDEHEEKKEEK